MVRPRLVPVLGLAVLLAGCGGPVGNAPVFQMVGAHVPVQSPPAGSPASTASASARPPGDLPPVAAAPRDEVIVARTLDEPGATGGSAAAMPVTPAAPVATTSPSRPNSRVSSVAPAAPSTAETAKAAASAPAPMPAGGLATVMPGDTVQAVSRRTGVSVRDLIELNGLEPPFTVVPGQTLALSSDSAAVPAAPDRAKPMAASLSSGLKPPSRTGTRFSWPLRGDLIDDFGPRGPGQHNDGINIRASRGAPVKAAEAGVVVYTGNELKGLGNLLLLRHDGGWVTAYAHTDKITVKRGDIVKRGQVVAQAGSSGNVSTPQLHFEVRRGTKPVNPLDVLETQTASDAPRGRTARN